MTIFVVGSSRHLTEPDKVTKFRDFCTDLGGAIARKRWTVLAGSVDSGTADHWLLQGMGKEAVDGVTIDAHIYRNEAVDENTFPRFRLQPHTDFPNMTVAHISAISAADAVVVIGGSKKTPGAAWAGLALEKPVILLRQFGGTSADLWHDMHQEYAHALEKRNYNALSRCDCEIRELSENTMLACEQLVATAKQKAFSSAETLLYSALALVFGVIAFLMASNLPLAWWRAVVITVLSVLTGWLLAQLIASERKGLMLSVPYAVMLSLVILAVVALGHKMLDGIIDETKANTKSAQLFFPLYGTGLLSGFGARTALLKWLKKLSEKLPGVPSIEHD